MSKKQPTRPLPSAVESDAPEGWVETTLDQLLSSLESGSRPRGGVRGISEGKPSIGGEHLNDEGGFRFDNIRYVPEEFYRGMLRGRIQIGDVLVVKDGATTGKVSLVRQDFPYPEAVVNEHVFVCRPAPNVQPAFLFWYLWSREGHDRILENFQGSAQGGINQSFAPGTPVPLAPAAEQTRIVAKVEELLGRVNPARARLAKLPAILKRFRQSILAAASSGQLTTNWRSKSPATDTAEVVLRGIASARQSRSSGEDARGKRRRASGSRLPNVIERSSLPESEFPDIPGTWAWVSCGDLCQPERALTYGVIKLGPEVADGVPTLRSSDVRWLAIEDDHIKRISPRIAAEFSRTFLEGGELLITVRGTLGGVVVAPAGMRGYNVSREVAVVPLEPTLAPWFFAFAVAADWSQNWLSGVTKGVAYTGVNIEDLKRLPLPVPPLSEQSEIVRRVEALFALADGIEAHVRAAAVRAERLPHSVLDRAFRGELVPTEADLARAEGRDYEPASVLLEQIQEEREASRSAKAQGKEKRAMARSRLRIKESVTATVRRPLMNVFSDQTRRLTPEQLFQLAGFDESSVDEFYQQLRGLVKEGLIKEIRPNKKDVLLEAARK